MSAPTEPFVDFVQRALMRPERLLGSTLGWKRVKRVAEPIVAAQRRSLEAARVFRLSDDFTRLAVDVSMQPAETFANALSCARAPYDKVWIEWNERVRLEHLAGHDGEDAAERIGWLIEREAGTDTTFRVSTFWTTKYRDADTRGLCFQSPVAYRFSTEGPITERFMSNGKDSMLWDDLAFEPSGTVPAMIKSGWPENVAHELTGNTRLAQMMLMGRHWVGDYLRGGKGSTARSRLAMEAILAQSVASTGPGWYASFGDMTPQAMAKIENEKANGVALLLRALQTEEGDLRLLVSVLALLQSKWVDKVQTRQGGAPRTVHTRTGKWLDIHECTITAPKERIIRAYGRYTSSGASKRRHEVIGHFCERLGSGKRDCVHEYQTNEKHQQVCQHCGHTRWWRAPHFRGDEKIGMVAKTYNVIAPNEGKQT